MNIARSPDHAGKIRKKITIIIIIIIITIIIMMMMIKMQAIHDVLLRFLTRNLALQMYYLPFEVCPLRHSNPGQHRQTSFIVHFAALNKRPYLMTVIHFVSHFVNLRFFGNRNLLRTTQMKITYCQTLHSFKDPGTLNEKLHTLLRLNILKTIPTAFTRSSTSPFRPNKRIPPGGGG